MSKGMVLEISTQRNRFSHTVAIPPDMQFGEIWFFPQGEENYRSEFGFLEDNLSESLIPWKGYATYKAR
jgi:hypothetical protein